MTAKLQQVADSLASSLQRDVAIDDPAMRLIAHSPHFGPVDHVRQESIMHRKVPPEAAQWLLAQGIADSSQPMRLPGNESCAMLPRVCAPIRCRDVLLGFLYLIDDPPLSADEVRRVADAAAAAGETLFEERLLVNLERSRERELLRDLLSDDQCLAEAAATELVEQGLAPASCLVLVLVFWLSESFAAVTPQEALAQALEEARCVVPSRRLLHLIRRDHGAAILLGHNRGALTSDAKRLSEVIPSRLAHPPLAAVRDATVIGIGDVHTGLIASSASYREGSWAAKVASAVPELGPALSWSELGVYRHLAKLPRHVLEDDLVHEGVTRLIADGHSDLVTTLETYLDLAGDAKRTAAALRLHRTSLYYRLGRIEQLTGADLHDGHDRLQLHLALKAARLTGMRHRPPARPTNVQAWPRRSHHSTDALLTPRMAGWPRAARRPPHHYGVPRGGLACPRH